MIKLNERETAVVVLMDIEQGAYNTVSLKRTLAKNAALLPVQRAFVTEGVNGAVRNLIYIDYVIDSFSSTPVNKMKPLIRNTIRLGVYQILFMDKVPDSAACNEAVNFVKKNGFKGLSGFVNGLLRAIARNGRDIKLPDRAENFVKYLSVKHSLPEWLINYWLTWLDRDTVERLCIAGNSKPSVTVCVNTLKSEPEAVKSLLESEGMTVVQDSDMSCLLHLKDTGDLSQSNGFKDGLFHVMDKSAAMAADAVKPESGQLIYDLCAAPGGKSFYMAYAMRNKGRIISGDIHPHKLDLIISGAERLGIDIIQTELADATRLDSTRADTADGLILDAPCSGFGLIRKKPDIRYNKTMVDVEALAVIQRQMLSSAQAIVKPGGTLVYSTCTLSKIENEDNVNWFLERYPFEALSVTTIMPELDGCDGFFVARMMKRR